MGLDPSMRARAEVRKTWQALRPLALPLKVLCESWPPAPPRFEGGRFEESSARSGGAHAWLLALAAFDELREHRDWDTLLRRSVELLRDPIGIERVGIFLLDPEGKRLFGTWGTGAAGETTDERRIAFDVGTSHREAFTHARSGSAQWSRFDDVPLFAETAGGTIVLRSGENVIIPIPGRAGSLGIVACDWALTGARADVDVLLRATVFTRVLAPQLERLASEAFPSGVDPAMFSSENLEHGDTRLAALAAALLHDDPNEERLRLARRLGTTPGKLGRAFKATLGESLRDYKNRVRLQRFLAIVDPRGGDLLEAALDAGFGSYAQFHRVFRHAFGRSPIEYLREQRDRR